MNNDFQYSTNLEDTLIELAWVNRNIQLRHIIDEYLENGTNWTDIPKREKILNSYYNFRQSRLIGKITRLSSFDRSRVTEEFKNLAKETVDLIISAIENKKEEIEV